MKTINENRISKKFIDVINKHIDNLNYSDSLFIFEEDDHYLVKEIRSNLKSNEFLKKYINQDSYIVIRCVKSADTERCYEAHFDNYRETFVIPLMVPSSDPKGELFAWFFARRTPKNILEHLLTKAYFQNRIFRFIFKKYLLKRFIKIDVNVGDFVFFDGFTTLHYNNPVYGERRSILVHNKKVFTNSLIVKFIEAYSKYKVR